MAFAKEFMAYTKLLKMQARYSLFLMVDFLLESMPFVSILSYADLYCGVIREERTLLYVIPIKNLSLVTVTIPYAASDRRGRRLVGSGMTSGCSHHGRTRPRGHDLEATDQKLHRA